MNDVRRSLRALSEFIRHSPVRDTILLLSHITKKRRICNAILDDCNLEGAILNRYRRSNRRELPHCDCKSHYRWHWKCRMRPLRSGPKWGRVKQSHRRLRIVGRDKRSHLRKNDRRRCRKCFGQWRRALMDRRRWRDLKYSRIFTVDSDDVPVRHHVDRKEKGSPPNDRQDDKFFLSSSPVRPWMILLMQCLSEGERCAFGRFQMAAGLLLEIPSAQTALDRELNRSMSTLMDAAILAGNDKLACWFLRRGGWSLEAMTLSNRRFEQTTNVIRKAHDRAARLLLQAGYLPIPDIVALVRSYGPTQFL